MTFSTAEALDQAIEGLDLTILEIFQTALFLAGKAFIRSRREGGT